jgi:rare lipoprotein A
MPRSRRRRATLVAVLATGLASWAAGPAGAASGPDDPPGSASRTGGATMPALVAPSTGGIGYGTPGTRSLVARPTALLGRAIEVRGTMPGAARRTVILQRLDPRRGWRGVAASRVRSTQRFVIRWQPDRSGRVRLRAVLARRSGAQAAAAAPVVAVTVYRPAMASYYGPGFFGRRTACGLTMTPELHGVAHRRLPCGTRVRIMYRDREIAVPVVDRGPFSDTFSWDLTQATADALGFRAGPIGYTREAPRGVGGS